MKRGVILKEDHRLGVFGNRVLKGIIRYMSEEVAG
jgi:hypothetical protein